MITDQTNKLITTLRELIKRSGPLQIVFAKKLLEITREYSKTQQYAKELYKIQLEKLYKIQKPNATQQEISILLNMDHTNTNQIVKDQESQLQESKDQNKEIQYRQHDIVQIEKSLTGLIEVMQEIQALLSVLITNQSNIILQLILLKILWKKLMIQ